MKNVVLLTLLVFLFGCGSADQQPIPDQPEETVAVPKVAPKQFNTDELAVVLPSKIQGYLPKEKPGGLDMELANVSFSFATQYYYTDSDSINIELHDYLDAAVMFQDYARLWWEGGAEVDNEEFTTGWTFFDEGIYAWKVFEQSNKRSTIYVGVDNRFYLIFECFGRENIDFILEVASSFDYEKLR